MVSRRGNIATREYWSALVDSLRASPPSYNRLMNILEGLRGSMLKTGIREDMAVVAEVLDIDFIRRRVEISGSRVLIPIYRVISTLVPVFRRLQSAHREVVFDALWAAIKARVDAKLRIPSSSSALHVPSVASVNSAPKDLDTISHLYVPVSGPGTLSAASIFSIKRATEEVAEQFAIAREGAAKAIPSLSCSMASRPVKRNTPAIAPFKMAKAMITNANASRELDMDLRCIFERYCVSFRLCPLAEKIVTLMHSFIIIIVTTLLMHQQCIMQSCIIIIVTTLLMHAAS